MLEKGKACRIEPDAISLGLVKPRQDNSAIAGLSLPVVQKGPGALSMKEEAATFAGIAPEPAGTDAGEDSRQTVVRPPGRIPRTGAQRRKSRR